MGAHPLCKQQSQQQLQLGYLHVELEAVAVEVAEFPLWNPCVELQLACAAWTAGNIEQNHTKPILAF